MHTFTSLLKSYADIGIYLLSLSLTLCEHLELVAVKLLMKDLIQGSTAPIRISAAKQ